MAIDTKYGSPDIPGIPADEPVFILRAQDQAAAMTIDDYRDNAKMEGATDDFIESVTEALEAFEKWADSHDTKIPD